MSQSSSIAVFDTGAGGLSVVNSLRRILPYEDIRYFADTANLPYGIKSPELIKRLSLDMAKKIVEISSCKVLVVACHTISVSCLDDIKAAINIPVIGMVEPSMLGLKEAIKNHALQSIGVLSTQATKNSGVYRTLWPTIDPRNLVTLIEHASSPLVYAVEEEGLIYGDMQPIVAQFIPATLRDVDALLIGCTHFSALKPILANIVKPDCLIVDAADFVADRTMLHLKQSGLLRKGDGPGSFSVFVTDNQERFINIAQRFIKDELSVTLIKS